MSLKSKKVFPPTFLRQRPNQFTKQIRGPKLVTVIICYLKNRLPSFTRKNCFGLVDDKKIVNASQDKKKVFLYNT